jgi:hypothetical protein
LQGSVGTHLVLQKQQERVMNGPARLLVSIFCVTVSFITGASAQINLQPTPQPVVTAENETWYRAGEPVRFAGNLYYPAGPAIHFIGNEMVRSGFHQGVPLYSRTTIEPYSVVFVPVGGGMMQPYERRRSGELAGTSGSSVSSLPVDMASASATPPSAIQAPAPPMVTSASVVDESVAFLQDQPSAANERRPVASRGIPERVADRNVQPARDAAVPRAVGTASRVSDSHRAATRVRRQAPNGIFVEYSNERWFSSGPPASLDPRRLTRVGEWHGFPVYVASGGPNSTLYIPIAQGADALAPYSKRR